MKTWILSSDSRLASTQELVRAASQLHIETEVLNPLELHFEFGHRGLSLFHLGRRRRLPDLVVGRFGWETLEYGLRLLRFFEAASVRVLNSASSFALASDKLSSLQIFAREGLAIPQTRFSSLRLSSESQLLSGVRHHVFKTLMGSQGFGVTWQFTREQSIAQVDAYRTVQAPFLVQELVSSSANTDVRAFVIDGKVVASMKRRSSRSSELRSNLHQGGKASSTRLSVAERELVLRACSSLGLFYAGVDFLRSSQGPLLLEANPSPGFDGIRAASGVDVAAEFWQRVLSE